MDEAGSSEAERRLGLPAGEFPFESRYADVGGARIHYIDEGAGPLLLMIHGNPAWSRLYRDVVSALRGEFRCIALDLSGFGLSTPPPAFSFLPEDHARLTTAFVEQLDLRDATLVANDWGGPIGIATMRATEGRITRLCLGNTWAWPVNGELHFEWFSKLLGGPIGRIAAERWCVFVNFVMPSSMRRRKMTEAELNAFRAPFRALQARRAMHVFPKSITSSGSWLGDLEAFVRSFEGPAQFIWPENDIAFRESELEHWRGLLPQARVARLAKCGHFLWLEAPEECAAAIRGFARR